MGSLQIEDLHYTYDDYKQWEGDWELFEGLPVAMSPAPTRKHQSIASAIIGQFYNQLDECERCEVLGEVDYKINESTVLRPDISFACDGHGNDYLTKAPEIIVEIISKSTAKRDEVYKFNIYEREKVKYYIIIYPDDLRAKVYKLRDRKYDKEGDFFNEVYSFGDLTCLLQLDFGKVFKRLK